MSFLYFPEAKAGFRFDQLQSFTIHEDGVQAWLLNDTDPLVLAHVDEVGFLDMIRQAEHD